MSRARRTSLAQLPNLFRTLIPSPEIGTNHAYQAIRFRIDDPTNALWSEALRLLGVRPNAVSDP